VLLLLQKVATTCSLFDIVDNIMIARISFVLAGQLKTNTPHYIHFSNRTRFYVMSSRISSNPTRYDDEAGTIRKKA
jgi:type IV secretory pathway component VirB8